MALSVFEFDKEREFRIVREDERNLGHEEGFNEGMKCGMERGISAFVKQSIKYGETKEKAIVDASIEFNMTKEHVENILLQIQ